MIFYSDGFFFFAVICLILSKYFDFFAVSFSSAACKRSTDLFYTMFRMADFFTELSFLSLPILVNSDLSIRLSEIERECLIRFSSRYFGV